jgi:hypothetical protein
MFVPASAADARQQRGLALYGTRNTYQLTFIYNPRFTSISFLEEQSEPLCRFIKAPFRKAVAEQDKLG